MQARGEKEGKEVVFFIFWRYTRGNSILACLSMVKQKPKSEVKKTFKTAENGHISKAMRVTQWIGTPKSILIHTLFFIGIFALYFFKISTENILLILTTAVSLEAIYLSILIQMTINENTRSLKAVEEDVDELQKDVEGIEEDVDDISEDIDKIQAEEEEDDHLEKTHTMLIEKMESQMQVIVNELKALKQKSS